MAARFFHQLGASLLDRTICSSAGGDALAATYGAQGRHARRALRREPADRDLGQQLDHVEPALLDARAGRPSAPARSWSASTRAAPRPPTSATSTSRCCPAPTARWRSALMHELIVNDWLDHDYIERHIDGWPALRERALRMAARARRRGLRHRRPTQVRALARDYGTTKPAAIRLNYGMQRVRGGGNAARLIALPAVPGRRLARIAPAACCCRRRAGSAASQRRRAAAARPARRPPAAHDQHEHDRRRPAARAATAPTARVRAEDRGARRLQQQPGRGRARVGARSSRGFARDDLFTVVLEHFHDRHRRPRRLRAAGDDAARALRRAHQLRPHLRADQRAGDRAARRGASRTRRSSARSRRAWASTTPCFADDDETLARDRVRPGERGVDFDALREHGWVKLRLPEAPFADGGFPTPSGKCRDRRARPRRARLRAELRIGGERRPSWRARYPLAMISPPARNFLNSTFVNVHEPARDRGRAGARDRTPTTRPRAASPTASTVRVFNDRGELPLQGRGQRARAARRRQRPGRLVAQARRATAPTSTS